VGGEVFSGGGGSGVVWGGPNKKIGTPNPPNPPIFRAQTSLSPPTSEEEISAPKKGGKRKILLDQSEWAEKPETDKTHEMKSERGNVSRCKSGGPGD